MRETGLLDSPPEERFDRISRLARRHFQVQACVLSLVDKDRQWFKSNFGLPTSQTPRDISLCGHVVATRDTLVVPDTRLDERFSDNPQVTAACGLRFYAGVPIYGPRGQPIGSFCLKHDQPRSFGPDDLIDLEDFAALVQSEIDAVELATRDHLTGLFNRRGFDLLAKQVLAACKRSQSTATLTIFDLDRFKAINDTHGHLAGDAALRCFAKCLAETFRESDLVARLGGDEFVVLLAGLEEGQLIDALERLERKVLASECGIAPFVIEYSVGIHAVDGDIRHAFSTADAAMYVNKVRRRRVSR